MNSMLAEQLRRERRRPSPAVARALRCEAHLSQETVAAAIGVHRTTLTRFETGHQRLRPAAAERLADVLAELEQGGVEPDAAGPWWSAP